MCKACFLCCRHADRLVMFGVISRQRVHSLLQLSISKVIEGISSSVRGPGPFSVLMAIFCFTNTL